MSGQLVIAELEAFRAVLGKAKRRDGETVRLWCRSTIPNALHRTGPNAPMRTAAEVAWAAADELAERLDAEGTNDDAVEPARGRALDALKALVAAVRLVKTAGRADL